MRRMTNTPHSLPHCSVDEVLQDHLRTREHIEKLGLLPLSPILKGTMWGLRIYVLFMICVVVINIVKQMH